MKQLYSKNSIETQAIASKLIYELGGKGIICLYGKLGAGKTTFAKGCAKAVCIDPRKVKSPSFTYIREYRSMTEKKMNKKMIHCDFYRFERKKIHIEETLHQVEENPDNLIVIEWPEKLQKLPEKRTDVFIEIKDENTRKITIRRNDQT